MRLDILAIRGNARLPAMTAMLIPGQLWRPCTPAMAAGVTDHVWSFKEVLLYRVPPWPQAQAW